MTTPDLLTALAPVVALKEREFDQLSLQRIRRDTIGDETAQLEVAVASPEDVILKKLEWYKKGDEVSQRQWLDAIGVLKVQRGQLDFDYLRKWSVELALAESTQRNQLFRLPTSELPCRRVPITLTPLPMIRFRL